MYVIGINAYHGDSSACLVEDGRLVAAAEEERFRRVKHWAGFPSEAVKYCLAEANVDLGAVEYVAVNTDPKANMWKKMRYTIARHPQMGMVMDRLRKAGERQGIEEELIKAIPGSAFTGKVRYIEHHRAHLASSFYVSGFDHAAIASVDGFGDFASAAWGRGEGPVIEITGRVHFPHSLGIFYEALTQFLGFPHYGDEYKVMGLAPYGEPRYMEQMREIVRLNEDGGYSLNLDYFRHHREKVSPDWNGGAPAVGRLYAAELERLLGPARDSRAELDQRHRDIARSVQAMYEEAFFHLLRHVHERHPTPALALAGGCAMNSVANGKITQRSPFKKVYIQAAAGDAGGALGAALAVSLQECPDAGCAAMKHAYWGPRFDNVQIRDILADHAEQLEQAGCEMEFEEELGRLCSKTAQSLSEGGVVGWFQGRMEWGPRALGNRSILGDPRRPDMKDILNHKIKRRESFRPFAPSVLREAVDEWFETDADVPFMMQVFQIREEKRAAIPAVTHVDGSGRLQTVSEESNPLYHRLIKAFERRTGVPMVLNTSFNENEPVVCTPQEALDCFLRTRMDVLVMGNWLVRRAPGA